MYQMCKAFDFAISSFYLELHFCGFLFVCLLVFLVIGTIKFKSTKFIMHFKIRSAVGFGTLVLLCVTFPV